jgi:Undecaprenyl-phosphate glucose phosphotransferase
MDILNSPRRASLPGTSETWPVVGSDSAAIPLSDTRAVVSGFAQFADVALVLGIGWLALLAEGRHSSQEWRFGVLIVALGPVLLARILEALGGYDFSALERWTTGVARSTVACCLTLLVLCGVLWLTGSSIASSKSWLEPWLFGSLAAVCTARFGIYALIVRWQSKGALARRVVVVGTGPVASRLLDALASDPSVTVEGVYDDRPRPGTTSCAGFAVLGSIDRLIEDCRRVGAPAVYIALPLHEEARIATVVDRLTLVPVDIRVCPDGFGLGLGTFDVSHVGGITLLNVRELPLGGWRLIAKEIEDRILAACLLTLTAPLFAVLAVAIKLDSPGPVFFRQMRHGYNNRLIRVFKFRTLFDHATDFNAEKLSDDYDPRVTRVGAILRRTMLDELPQFINVLRGEMSVVGPRPHAMAAKAGGLLYRDAVPKYDARHRMKPGVTGWAQVNGWRGDTKTIEQIRQRVAHDLHYIEHWSIAMDLKIVLMTVVMAFRALYSTMMEIRRHAMPVVDAGRSGPTA